ncbi:FUSC family protein [Gordonia sp. GONU]|uniref:FUSC family protein n=1 Tax=Gordonia sp. GONU TaxID=2972949 RepID=UPI0021ACC516|nr:FUSC family protein [Gordonia sp. GONU]MCR8896080.1 FUSC family protein [Gordonia sp. GONU]
MAPPFAPTALFTTRDPAAARLRKAARGASAMAIAASAVLVLRTFVDLPAAAELSGGFLGLWATVGAVKDTTSRARIATTLLLLIPGFAAGALACLMHPWPAARAVAFIMVAGAAAWSTRYGPRGSALGFFGFFTFFFGVVMNAGMAEFPVLAGLVVIAVCSALFVRLVLIRDRPAGELARALRGVRVCADDLLRLASRPTTGPDRLAAAVTRLAAATGVVADWQHHYGTERYVDVGASTLAQRMSVTQLACEQSAYGVSLNRTDVRVLHEVGRLRQVLRARSVEEVVESTGTGETVPAAGSAGARSAIEAIGTAVDATIELRAITFRPHLRGGRSMSATVDVPPAEPVHRAARPDTTRFALQVMVATSVAVGVGGLISASRWYWAVLSAFMVFNGMATRGAILTKAVRRVQGTIVGLVVGVVAVYLIGHHPPVQYAIIVCSVFLAFYLASISYTWTILFITILLTTTFDLLGVLDRQVIEWRVEETLAGALVGSAAAFLVLSSPTTPVLDTKLRAYFDALVDTAEAALRRGSDHAVPQPSSTNESGPSGPDAVLAAASRLDAAEAAILDAAASAIFALSRTHRAMVRRLRPELRATTREARGLAWSVVGNRLSEDHRTATPPNSDADDGALEELRNAVAATLSAVEHPDRRAETTAAVPVPDPRAATAPADPTPARQVERIAESVSRMGSAAVPARTGLRTRELARGRVPRASSDRVTRRG